MTITLTPAYGQDYKSKAEALADFNADKDFILNDFSSHWDGKPVNRSQLVGRTVKIRYASGRRVFVVTVAQIGR
jgi:hypothetical protein